MTNILFVIIVILLYQLTLNLLTICVICVLKKPPLLNTYILVTVEARAKRRIDALKGIAGSNNPSCVCCGFNELWGLTFDHIYGGGVAHRRANSFSPTMQLVRKAKKDTGKWPTDTIQILCALCNHGRRVNNGVCPHQNKGGEL